MNRPWNSWDTAHITAMATVGYDGNVFHTKIARNALLHS
jgi:hypothetical protein